MAIAEPVEFSVPEIPIDKIIIGKRFREELGDIKALAESIRDVGLIHPIVVDINNQLIAGRRRLAAFEHLERKEIPVTIINIKDIQKAEIAENVERKDFICSELVAVTRYLKPELEAEAKKRQEATHLAGKDQEGAPIIGASKLDTPKGRTDEKIAKYMGVGKDTLRKAETIVETAEEDPRTWGELLKKVDSDETSIDAAFKKIQAQERADEKAALARTGKTMACIKKQECKEFLNELDDKSVDLLLTDPPYYTDVDDIELFVDSWLDLALSKIKDTGQAYIFIGAYPIELKTYLIALENGEGKRFKDPQILVWVYKNTIGPKPKRQYKRNWFAILYLRGPKAPDLNCIDLVEQNSVQEFSAPDARHEIKYHKWQKPLELAKSLITQGSNEDSFVVDPFAGSGTFLLAAAELGRENMGVDINEEAIQKAVERGCILND
ncbi:hypothetical protein LCGC14_1673010 [marine sediment metagenome]|uniref:ParB-like N-terminal domain-containing protein n=1 Tax=marine sediment metagenome TaxID=412755 RepID=A0A0F9K6J7_9ZZZZ